MMSLNIGDGPDKAAAMEEGTTAEAQSPKQILKDYLLERVPVFQRLMELKLKVSSQVSCFVKLFHCN